MELQTADELERMFQDTGGVPIQLAGAQTYGHFEILDEVVLSQLEVLVRAPTVLFATGKLPGLEIDATVLVDGAAWGVRRHQRETDGALTRILLKEM